VNRPVTESNTIDGMSDNSQIRSLAAVPNLRYRNLSAAIGFLAEAFGLEATFIATGKPGQVVHAQLRAGSTMIYLSPDVADDRYGMHSPLALNGTNQCLCLVIAGDVDEHATHAEHAGAELINPPHDTDFGGREYSCRDPEGHVWTIGTYAGEPEAVVA